MLCVVDPHVREPDPALWKYADPNPENKLDPRFEEKNIVTERIQVFFHLIF